MSANHAIEKNADKKTVNKKTIAVVAVVAGLVLGGGGAAFAYWTSSGTGSGTASTGENTPFTITAGDITGPDLTPGGPSQTHAFTVANPSSGVQRLTSVTVTVANANGTPWTSVTGCLAEDYAVGTVTIATPADIAAGGNLAGSVIISMVNSASNQNGCQNADVPLYFQAN